MKKIVSFLFCLCPFFIAGCATTSSVMYTNVKYPPTDASKIEVYSTTTPKKEYIELAEIPLSSHQFFFVREKYFQPTQQLLEKVKEEAARLGADAIIMPVSGPRKFSYRDPSYTRLPCTVDPYAIDTSTGVCVAIKFK
ncbi:hypothetical protein AGMMS49593_01970 [Endomicrobiia bacterium]|nr:hypothetical protein AGMMS49593_01970 [Endomicrobiia bacterium]